MNLKKNFPTFMDRVKILDADLQHPGVGLSEESIDYIVKNAQIVFHAASDVRFDQALKKAIEVNVRGTRDLLRICEKIVNLEVTLLRLNYYRYGFTKICYLAALYLYLDCILKLSGGNHQGGILSSPIQPGEDDPTG